MRLFVSQECFRDGSVVITGADVKHAEVLRLVPGDHIEISDGTGWEYLCRISRITASEIRADCVARRRAVSDPEIHIHLFQGVAKGERMDYCIQKVTEVGVSEITPVITQRCVVDLRQDKAARRVERWQRIAREAAKQSGRSRIPKVNDVVSYEEALRNNTSELTVFPWEEERGVGLRDLLTKGREKASSISLLIGPEGGFTTAEAQLAESAGAVFVSLGPRILRTETAGPVALALILYEWGDVGRGGHHEDWSYL